MEARIYEIKNIHSARQYLSETTEAVIISNPEGSTRDYGMRVLVYIFKTLQNEDPVKIITGI